jgi:hypothetical protein
LVELMNASGRRNRTKFRDSFIKPLLEEGFLVLTIPRQAAQSDATLQDDGGGIGRVERAGA